MEVRVVLVAVVAGRKVLGMLTAMALAVVVLVVVILLVIVAMIVTVLVIMVVAMIVAMVVAVVGELRRCVHLRLVKANVVSAAAS